MPLNFQRHLRRLRLDGDFWTLAKDWGVRRVPFFLEPIFLFTYTLAFFLVCAPPRRAVMANLAVIIPGSEPWANFFRAFRVFWNFSWSMVDTTRAQAEPDAIDWEIVGLENFQKIANGDGGAVILTAHMGSYDLAAPVFAGKFKRKMNAVRAPERQESLQDYAAGVREANESDAFSIKYNRPGNMLGIELAKALAAGEVVAIQGDRIMFDVAPVTTVWNGRTFQMPKGPFALAAASKCPLYPIFIVRTGWRSYRILVGGAMDAGRHADDTQRNQGLNRAVDDWRKALEGTVREYWHNWFVFEEVFQ